MPTPYGLRPSAALRIAMEEFLLAHYPSRKRPTVAAATLALVVELHKKGQAFPVRQDAADALACSVFGVDAALSVAMSRGLLSIHMKVTPGSVSRRESACRERYFIPDQILLDAAAAAASTAPGRLRFKQVRSQDAA